MVVEVLQALWMQQKPFISSVIRTLTLEILLNTWCRMGGIGQDTPPADGPMAEPRLTTLVILYPPSWTSIHFSAESADLLPNFSIQFHPVTSHS